MTDLSRTQFSGLTLQNRDKRVYKSDKLSVAQLFELVKKCDNEFNPNPVNLHFLMKTEHRRYFITEQKPSLLFLTAVSVQGKYVSM